MNFKGKGRKNRGITLIALVITIIVLLILAGVTINTLFGNESVLEKASEAKIKDEESSEFDSIKLAVVNAMAEGNNGKVSAKNLKSQLEGLVESTSGITDESTGSWTVKGKITGKNYTITENGNVTKEGEDGNPETEVVPKVGDTVNYAPSGSYTWDKSLAESTNESVGSGTEPLSSAENGDYRITKWKILSYDADSKIVEMVPTEPVGNLTLGGAQGYNNAVYLLNNACKSLYGNERKGIEARSIKEEDFVKAGGEDWETKKAKYKPKNGEQYGKKCSHAFTSDKNYPIIYEQEKNSVITPDPEGITKELEQSEQKTPIKVTDVESIYKEAETNIQPYQTFYNTSDYDTTKGLLKDKAEILLPNGINTKDYWVASRCINTNNSYRCYFSVNYVISGELAAGIMYSSDIDDMEWSRALFPVVTLSSELLVKSEEPNTYDVKID